MKISVAYYNTTNPQTQDFVLRLQEKILLSIEFLVLICYNKFYFSYHSGKDKAIAYKLKNVAIYEKPKALSDYGIRQAPQFFVYL